MDYSIVIQTLKFQKIIHFYGFQLIFYSSTFWTFSADLEGEMYNIKVYRLVYNNKKSSYLFRVTV